MPTRREFVATALCLGLLPQRGLAAPAMSTGGAHRFQFIGIDGAPMPLSAYAGRLLLVVNTASRCAYTPQYRDLEALWDLYGARGLTVIGTPSNDFGGQEPKSEQEIQGFCSGEYGVSFPLTEKIHVRGQLAHPFYRWAETEAGFGNAPRWNFHKYLIGADGRLIAAFPSAMNPQDPRLVAAIKAHLPAG